MWKPTDSDFNLSRHLIPFLQDVPFYSELSRHIEKRFTYSIPTMAVTFDMKADALVMWVNPVFMGGGTYQDEKGESVTCEPLSNSEIRGGLTHEYDHLVFGHLNSRRREPAGDWSIGTDLAINSMIEKNAKKPRDVTPEEEHIWRALPKIALIPGKRPFIDPVIFSKLPPERQKACTSLSDLIEKLPPLKSSEYYFNKVLENSKKNGGDGAGEGAVGIIGSMDDHTGWDETAEESREYIEGKIKGVIEKAVRHADSMADGWGNIPADIREEIRKSVSNIVNWRAVLRQFVGSIVRGKKTSTMKRINKRYPYIHPGTKRGYTAKLLIAVDESGSVNDEMLEMFFAELDTLTRQVDITLLHFDCSADIKDLYEWRKGTRPKLKRIKAGGTNFDAPTRLANDPKNRGRWDGMLIMTDGQAGPPEASRIKRGWVLGQNCKLAFASDEIQIFLTKETAYSGAWR